MWKRVPLDRFIGLGASCALHVALVGAAIGLGLGVVAAREPKILLAQLVPAEPPRLIEAPRPRVQPPTPRRGLHWPDALTRSKPVAPPAAEAVTSVETKPQAEEKVDVAPSSPAVSAVSDGRPAAGPAGAGVSDEPPPPTRSTGAALVASTGTGVTQLAIPRGGYQVRPAYPQSARRLGVQGTTTLRVFVANDGRVGDVLVDRSAGHPDLDQAAADAVKRWRFEPARRGAEPVGMWVLLPVEFRLR